jgi:hypothetical protein
MVRRLCGQLLIDQHEANWQIMGLLLHGLSNFIEASYGSPLLCFGGAS